MSEPSSETPAETPVLFRRGKKKATYRQRDDDAAADAPAPATDAPTRQVAPAAEPRVKEEDGASDGGKEDVEDAGLSVAEVLRLRNARKNKARNLNLRADAGPRAAADEAASTDLAVKDEAASHAAAVVAGLGRRFAAQTGLVGELVNRHMEEYIESELARRKQAAGKATASTGSSSTGPLGGSRAEQEASDAGRLLAEAPAQPATRGKLQEVDLGQEMRQRNAAETERAKKRLRGEAGADSDQEMKDADQAKSAKRSRRPSEDALRDKMVEEFLRENKMESYQMEDVRESEDGRPHDAKVAEEFRREFMEAIYQRNRRRRPAINQHKRPPKRDESEILKGPKLGGSRNSRAAVREILLKEANEKRAAERR